jgi:hypothetical protein
MPQEVPCVHADHSKADEVAPRAVESDVHQHRPRHPSDQGVFASILPRADELHVYPLLKPAGRTACPTLNKQSKLDW